MLFVIIYYYLYYCYFRNVVKTRQHINKLELLDTIALVFAMANCRTNFAPPGVYILRSLIKGKIPP